MSTSSLNYEFPVTLVFAQDNPCNCTISLDEKPLYEVKTRRKIVKKIGHNDLLFTTDVSRPVRGAAQGGKEMVASVIWSDNSTDLITWPTKGLDDAKLSVWLKRSLIPFSNSASFRDVEGNTYKWDMKGPRNQFRLVTDDNTTIVYFERANPYVNLRPGYNYNPAPKPSQLHLSELADRIRDEVVLSFLTVETTRRRRDGTIEKQADSRAIGASRMIGAVFS